MTDLEAFIADWLACGWAICGWVGLYLHWHSWDVYADPRRWYVVMSWLLTAVMGAVLGPVALVMAVVFRRH